MNLEPLRYIYLRRVVGTVLGMLGFDVASRMASGLARAVFSLNTPARRTAEARLRAALSPQAVSRTDIPHIIASMYEHTARFWIEALYARRLLRDSSWRRCVQIENETELRALANARRGCVLATAYFGNLAVGAYALGRIFRPIHVIVDAFAQPYLRSWQNELYADRWVRPIVRSDAGQAVPRILAAGGAIMQVCEHGRAHGRAVPVDFLGCTLNCYPTLDRLARWFDVPVGVFSCRRESCSLDREGEAPAEPRPLFSFTLSLHETIQPGVAAGDDGDVIRRVLSVLEQAIMAHPEQYLWSVPSGAVAPSKMTRLSRGKAYPGAPGRRPHWVPATPVLEMTVAGGQATGRPRCKAVSSRP
jgi:lauroyl/myristoyl acyltransferase